MQLVQDGKLKFTDTVERWAPELRDAGRITVHQLLTHSSGLGDYFGGGNPAALKRVDTTLDDFRLVEGGNRRFEPGAAFAYSNSAFIVLGLIIERITGLDDHGYTHKFIFEPAGMVDTHAHRVEELDAGTARGFTRFAPGGELRDNTDTLPRRSGAAGGGYSTGPDLLRFTSALLANKLVDMIFTAATLGVQSSDLALNPSRQPSRPYPPRGYPFFIKSIRGQWVAQHGGGAPGISNDVLLFPGRGDVLIVLSNLDGSSTSEVSDRAALVIAEN